MSRALVFVAALGGLMVVALADDIRFETSGVVRRGAELLFVSDEMPGTYLAYRIADLHWEENCARLTPERLAIIDLGQALSLDPEGVGILADGRVVLLSERLRGLVTSDGLVVDYDDPLGEMANAGLEGLAVRSFGGGRSEVAVLWEGGYLEGDRVPPVVQEYKSPKAVKPFIVIHEIERDAKPITQYKSRRTKATRVLDVPQPPGNPPSAQRFRAPDLVWEDPTERAQSGTENSNLIVLLNSRAAFRDPKLKPEDDARQSLLWLQRFSRDGARIGLPLDIDKKVPSAFGSLNWEGLGWWQEGKTLILVDDAGILRPATQPPAVCLVDIPPEWKISARGMK